MYAVNVSISQSICDMRLYDMIFRPPGTVVPGGLMF